MLEGYRRNVACTIERGEIQHCLCSGKHLTSCNGAQGTGEVDLISMWLRIVLWIGA